MTDEQIIDLLATKVMGWEKTTGGYWRTSPKDHVSNMIHTSIWNPLKFIQHAWMVVEKMGSFSMHSDDDGVWVRFEDHGGEASAALAPRAICLAALSAHGIMV